MAERRLIGSARRIRAPGGVAGGGSPPPQDPRVEDPDFDPREHGREGWEAWPGRVQVVAGQVRARGRLSAHEDTALRSLGGGRVDWRRTLRDFVTRAIGGDRTWSPPARRHVHRGLYLPSLRQTELQVLPLQHLISD